jgi:hypothetical protein
MVRCILIVTLQAVGVIPANLVILFAASVTKVKYILRSYVLLQCQVKYITGSSMIK